MNYNDIISSVHNTKDLIFDELSTSAVTVKGRSDFVTKVDLSVQNTLREILSTQYPDILFISEEQKENPFDSSLSYWILDPIDGTTNLIHHYQHSAVSLALYQNGRIEFGVVYNPFTEETFHAVLGQGAFLNGSKITTSSRQDFEDALITMGTSPYDKHLADFNFARFQKVFTSCADIRISGSSALDISYVAAGRLEGFFERNLKPWDYAAASLILTEAGGTITDWNLDPITFHKNCDICSSNTLLHEELRGHLL